MSTKAIARALLSLGLSHDVSKALEELAAIRKAARVLIEVPNDPAVPGAVQRWGEAVKVMDAIAKEEP